MLNIDKIGFNLTLQKRFELGWFGCYRLEGSVGAHTPGNPHRMKSSGRWWGWGGFELQGASKSEKRELEMGDQWNFL
jgi:hypothetical protein